MLRPTERITNCGRFVRARCSDEGISNFLKECRGNAANFFHHFGCVASEVAAQRLKNAARMLQGEVAFRKTKATITVIGPGFLVVATLLFIPTGEKSSRT